MDHHTRTKGIMQELLVAWIMKNMNVHDTEWAYYAVPLMVLALSIHNKEKERKIVMRKVMNRVLAVGIVLTVVYLFVEYYLPLLVK